MKVKPITDWNDVPIIMDLVMAGRIVGLTPDRLRLLSRRGEFPATRAGVEWRVEKDDLVEYLRNRRNGYQRQAVQVAK